MPFPVPIFRRGKRLGRQNRFPYWRPQDCELLYQGFIEVDLEEEELQAWLKVRGQIRSLDDIRNKLKNEAYFSRGLKGKLKPTPRTFTEHQTSIVKSRLQIEIEAARAEAPTAPVYRFWQKKK